MSESLGKACKRAQRAYCRAGASDAVAEERRRLFAQAIRRGVTYRQLAFEVGVTLGALHYLLLDMDTSRVDPLSEPVWGGS